MVRGGRVHVLTAWIVPMAMTLRLYTAFSDLGWHGNTNENQTYDGERSPDSTGKGRWLTCAVYGFRANKVWLSSHKTNLTIMVMMRNMMMTWGL